MCKKGTRKSESLWVIIQELVENDVSAGQLFVILTDNDCSPLSSGTVVVNGSKLVAGAECVCADGLNVGADGYGSKSEATEECVLADRLNACANYNALERGTGEECLSTDGLNGCGNYYALDIAALESVFSNSNYLNAVNLVGNNDVLVITVTHAGESKAAVNLSIVEVFGYLVAAVSTKSVLIAVVTVCGNNLLSYGLFVTVLAVLTCGKTVGLTAVSNSSKNYDIMTGCGNFLEGIVITFGAYLVCLIACLGAGRSLSLILSELVTECGNNYDLLSGVTTLGAANICLVACLGAGGSLSVNYAKGVVCNCGNCPALTLELNAAGLTYEHSVVRALGGTGRLNEVLDLSLYLLVTCSGDLLIFGIIASGTGSVSVPTDLGTAVSLALVVNVVVAKCRDLNLGTGNLSLANLTVNNVFVVAGLYAVGLNSVLNYCRKSGVAESGDLNVCIIVASCTNLKCIPTLVYAVGSLSLILHDVVTELSKYTDTNLAKNGATVVSTADCLLIVAVLGTGGVNSGALELDGMLGPDVVVLGSDFLIALLLTAECALLVIVPTDGTGSSLSSYGLEIVTGSKNGLVNSGNLTLALLTVNYLVVATVLGTGEFNLVLSDRIAGNVVELGNLKEIVPTANSTLVIGVITCLGTGSELSVVMY